MWYLMKRLLALYVLVLMTAVSAQAALTFGAAPAADSLIQSVPQAQRFGAYLEKRLGEPVDVRIFPNDRNLKEALNTYYDVDLAVVQGNLLRQQPTCNFNELANPDGKTEQTGATADMIVVRQGLDSDRLSRIQAVLAGMENDPEGNALLYNLGIQRFSQPENPKPAPTSTRAQQPASTIPTPSRKASTAPASEAAEFTLGIVADPGTPLLSKDAAENFAGTLGQQLNTRITVRVFKDEATLHEWLNRFRMVELALLSSEYLQKQPAGEFERLAQPTDLVKQKLTAGSWLVARQGLDPRQLARLSNSLEQLKGAPLAPSASHSAAAPRPTPATQPEIIRHTRPTRSPQPAAAFTPADKTSDKVTFGAVPGINSPIRSEEQIRTFAQYLENRLGTTVNVRTFNDQKTLQEWLSRYRMVDIALFDNTYLQKQPAGEFVPLIATSELGAAPGNRLVGRQGLDDALLTRVHNSLEQMKNNPEVARLFQTTSGSAPVATLATPGAIAPRPIAEPKPLITAAPAPVTSAPTPKAAAAWPVAEPTTQAPTPVPVTKPTLTPVVEAPAKSTIPAPTQAPVVPETPPAVVAKLPEAPKPQPVPQPETPVAARPALPEELFRPSEQREQIYLTPFITVMVPGTVAEQIFDTFVENLNADGMGQKYEFIILKGGLDSVDQAWLAEHNYVTGEVFGYVEESGCCSTDIRTKARVFLYRKGNAVPALQYEHPVKIFFDHDYSTIKKERQNIANNIAGELAAKVRNALSGS